MDDSHFDTTAERTSRAGGTPALRDQFGSASLWHKFALPAQIWRTRIIWRVAISVFLTILAVQSVGRTINYLDFRQEKLQELRQHAELFIKSAMRETENPLASPVRPQDAEKLFASSMVSGIAIYDVDGRLLQIYGEQTVMAPDAATRRGTGYMLANKAKFETIYTPSELSAPYYITARMYTASIVPKIAAYVQYAISMLLLLSVGVTAVLMAVLGKWFMEPLMILRNNLQSAARNPERPDIRRPRYDSADEVGLSIRMANDLIRQNAHNLRKLRAAAEDKIHRLAYYDALTGLPNRTFFLEKLNDQIKSKIVEGEGRLAVFAIDIDHFKDINDTMGHEFGDKLLETIGKRLAKALPSDALISRASADEFTAMVILPAGNMDSAPYVDSIFNAMSEPVSILHEKFQIRVSVGVAHCPDDGMEARQILKNADIALNRAKEEGRDTVRYYSEDFDLAVQQRFQLLRDLRTAIDENQLRLHFHPQFDLRTGQMIGAETLLRWWRPDNSKEGGSFISPNEFVPVAEQSGLIVPIGEWVLKTACKLNRQWQEKGLPPFRIAVNISGVQFHRADIVRQVSEALEESGLDPKYLELEITESVFMENMQTAIDILNQLHRLGVELAVDDFGTGYSSLSYLRQFPIDRLKIDQSFIRNALVNPDDRMIAKTIISLGHSLNLKVIAEGVESIDHENFLREEGCDEVQGFKYTKPLPQDQFRDYIVNYNRNLAKNTRLTVVEDGGTGS